MTNIRSIISKGFITAIVAIMAAVPFGTFAYASPNVNGDCTPPDPSSYGAGNHALTGSDAVAFVYQCPDPDNPSKANVGLWVSEHYVYNPQTNKKQPIEQPTYTYNDTSGQYDYATWDYSPAAGAYKLVKQSTATPPAGAVVVGAPAPAPAAAVTSSDPTPNTASAQQQSASSNGSTSVNTDATNDATITNNSSAGVTNTIGSVATSGNAIVLGNTTGGNATSGNAVTQADVINMLQSSSNALGGGTNVATFTYTIDGDVIGDLFFDPSLISKVQGDTSVDNTLTNNLTINNTSDATITNNLNLATNTGDATVADNTTGGSATSGSATTIANIVNSIQSSITAGKSFVGTVNITGNLNGDILLPADFVDQLVASNVPTVSVTAPSSTNSNTTNASNTTTVNNSTDQTVHNTVNSSAQSGDASVAGNTQGGTATSGKATTNVTAFNLTGHKIIAKNSILVFVNVLGKWTGLIVNAPAGATAAQLGGNVTQNSTLTNTSTMNNTTNQTINNNVNVSANTGDATVNHNTTGGNARSGDANTAVNLLNIEGSTIQLSDWFGILFINVFGTWNGSFGVNTDAGTVFAGKGGDEGPTVMLVGNMSQLVRYPVATTRLASTTTHHSKSAANGQSTNPATDESYIDDGSVLAAQTFSSTTPSGGIKAPNTPITTHQNNLLLPVIGISLGLAILASERFLTRRQS